MKARIGVFVSEIIAAQNSRRSPTVQKVSDSNARPDSHLIYPLLAMQIIHVHATCNESLLHKFESVDLGMMFDELRL